MSPCSTELVLEYLGDGYGPPAPDGSECEGEAKYALNLETRALEWSRCELSVDVTQPWQKLTGELTLSAAEFASVTDALGDLTVSDEVHCGVDKGTSQITVSIGEQSQLYLDDFILCRDKSQLYVANIDAAFSALDEVAR